ncbi:MAG: sugar phosphate isomerase/epimerase [Oscillospiraceae bacterium]|nr:sugar phosphate isomerase/epimerase [Oscillospiraceae bacterium]
MKNGIQVSSLKPLLLTQEQTAEAFSEMRALGCTTVQLQWIDRSVPIEAIARALKDNGMESVSVQDFYETVSNDFSYYTELNDATGGTWLCVSRIPERLQSRDGLDRFLTELRAMQKTLEGLGQKLCFHPVSADFTAVPGMDAVEYLLANMPELDICLDLYHLNRNCSDMPAFIRRYGPRICMVHFKDAVGGILVPAGQGDTNWNGVVRACLDAGVPYAFVEQERWDRDPYICLKEAIGWLDSQLEGASL